MTGTIKTIINEPDFEITIYEWNDLTLDILKSYTDWKYNGNQQITPKKETGKTVKINVKKPIEQEGTKEKTKPKKGNFNTLFSNEDKLTEPGDYGSSSLYKPILNFILENTNDTFTKKDITNNLRKFYKQKGWQLKESSAHAYETSYRRYMLDKEIIQPKDFENFTKIKKNPLQKISNRK